ncbi:YjjG family noncanonical pyrimidine nucleotidase [Peptostreptococcus equinus]|uniref:YjjG family noncanonical pyrimidine nucleotidase n=1 Tax=Peptostreptococcus equinus TaxID=3003601 RepID=A0ABY7JQY3_9FIRM|nr:YjjG family noncanonical pyrimidine nucleotidase [Peptostreptococcus sp. CBA3647]WAW15530.1 YjjG family noncanonical pyrimidine nucleotidase [Peptostreptococcus sp. CBA3647]
MFRYILWDIDRTLLNFDLSEDKSLKMAFEKFNLGNCSDKQLDEYKIINKKYWDLLEQGKISKEGVLYGRFEEFFSLYNIDKSIVKKFNSYYQECLGLTPIFNENALEVVRYLKGKYKQFAVTNGTATAQIAKLKNSGLDKILDFVFISEKIGYAKPFIGFFDKIFEYTNDRNCDKYLIIGDSLTSDIQGGINAGIQTCWYNPYNTKIADDIKISYTINNLKQVLDIINM